MANHHSTKLRAKAPTPAKSDETNEFRPVYGDPHLGDSTFALRVRDDSMVDVVGPVSFPPGCIIVVDPSIAAMPGDYVVVRQKGAEEATFKQLEFDGEHYFLKSLNPRHATTPMPRNSRIVGVVVLVQVEINRRAA